MKALDVVSTQLNFINLLDQAGYALSEIVVKASVLHQPLTKGTGCSLQSRITATLKWSVFSL